MRDVPGRSASNSSTTTFPAPAFPYASPKSVVLRDRKLQLDNGYCSNATTVQLFSTAQLSVAPCAAS